VARLGASVAGKRVYVTQIDEFMGPALVAAFREHGAEVLGAPGAREADLRAAGHIDVLLCNLGVPAPSTRVQDVGDEEWRSVFAGMVDPLPRLFRAVLPQMLERRAGKIVVMGSATALRGQKRTSTYAAARGAQLAYVRAVGAEVAGQNVQVNLIAQNFIENPMYYPAAVQALPAFQERLKREVPANRLGTAQEDALFAVFLASSEVGFITGQAIPFAGGWVA
jgi:NAD(P)-dependent dehydrogenase (short-subunit alcohol dehydrogenase family)